MDLGGGGGELALALLHELALAEQVRALAGKLLGGGCRKATRRLRCVREPGGRGSERAAQALALVFCLFQHPLGLGLGLAGELELAAQPAELLLGIGLGTAAQR